MSRKALMLFAVLAAVGCDDQAPGAGNPRDAAFEHDQGRELPRPDADVPDAAPPPAPDAAPAEDGGPDTPRPSGWVEVTLDPRRPLYVLEDTPMARGTVYDAFGKVQDGAPITWSVVPPGIARIGAGGVLELLGEGQGAVVGCAAGARCGRASFFVDAGPPTLIVSSPERGAILGADGSETIPVRGTATDTGGDVTVRVNGARVEVGPGGTFAVDVPARFGINRIQVTADDNVRRPAVRDVRSVLWAPRYEPAEQDRAVVPGALALRMDQVLLDQDVPVQIPAGAGRLGVDELAQVVEALLRLADLRRLLGDPNIAEGDAFRLSVVDVRLGEPEVDLSLAGGGFELFLRLPAVEIETRGALRVEGEQVSLDGRLRVGLAAYASMSMSLDGGLMVEVDDVELAVESIGGQFADPTAQVLVGTLGSRLQEVARGLASELVDGLVRDQLPTLVEEGLASLLDVLGSIPINLNTNIEGVPPVRLDIRMEPGALELRRRESLQIVLDAEVVHPEAVAAPYTDPGIPTRSTEGWLPWPGEGLGIAVRLELVNAVLHALWRSRLLQIVPPLPNELAGVLGEVRLDGRLPPVVVETPDAETPLQIQVGDLRLYTQGPMAQAPDVYSLDLRVGMSVRTLDGRIEMEVAGEPEIQAVLISQGSARPLLSEDGLATLIGAAVWPLIQDALAGGLGFGIDPVAVDPAALGQLAPRLRGLTITPRFVQAPSTFEGRLLLEGGMNVVLELGE